MRRTIPSVKDGRLYQLESGADPIVVGTPAWYDWLEQHTSFLFEDQGGGFTAQKISLSPHGLYWKASRIQAGKLYGFHLGRSHELTMARLQVAARTLASEHTPTEPTDASPTESPASMHQAPQTTATVGLYNILVKTKLYRPRSGSDVIPRARLIERLNAGLSGNITLVSAPAGFGKTTLLVEWVQTIDRPSAWLSLDEHDNELRMFINSLTAALQSVFPDAFQATASLFKAMQYPPLGEVASLLINDLADVPEDVVLVLDEYHLIHPSEVHTLLEMLIEHLPSQLHLVLVTRSDPPLPLARWRVRGYLNDLRGADLRFTLAETEVFLTRVLDNDLAHETAGALEELTAGWIALVRLAALSLRRTSDRMAFIERLRSSPDRNMSIYLVEEVLARQASAVQELLVRISMLEQFCVELCVAVMGKDDPHGQVQATLDWLERSNMFLVPLDERQGWYRFHHLFKQLLEQRLQERLSQEELAVLRRRASAWYAEQGLIEEAIQHALVAGDAAYAASLVEAQFHQAFEQEQLLQMERWLRLLPVEQVQSSPLLLAVRVWILQARGQIKDLPPLLTAAEQHLTTNGSGTRYPNDQQSKPLRALIATAWSLFQYFTGQAQASLESARSALAWLPPGEEYGVSLALTFLAWSNQALGQEEVALVALQQTLRDHSRHLNSTARLLFAQAVVYLAAGKLQLVEHTARHLLQIALLGDLALSQCWAHWLLGVMYYERNELDTAVYHFLAVITNQHLAHLWAVQDAMRGLALTYQAQGSGTQAQETARGLLEWVQEQHNLPELMTAYAFCGQLALLQGEVEEASRWLELAGEQEVQGPMWFLMDPPLTTAWMLLAKGDEASVARGQALLTRLLQYVQAMHSTRKTIQVLALQ